MFPVWPIIAVEEMLAALQRREDGLEVYALANIVSAATIAQLKMKCLTNGAENVTAASMEAECQRAKRLMEEQKVFTLTAHFLFFYGPLLQGQHAHNTLLLVLTLLWNRG